MRIHFQRLNSRSKSTATLVTDKSDEENPIDFGYVLEDLVRAPWAEKVPGETAIPAGIYRIALRKEGGMHDKYTKRFPDVHVGMLWLQDVPNFEWVYSHTGLVVEHTRGCLLHGDKIVLGEDGEYEIPAGHTVPAYLKFYQWVVAAILRGEEVYYIITDPNWEAPEEPEGVTT